MSLQLIPTDLPATSIDVDTLVIGLHLQELSASARAVDLASGGLITALLESGDLSAKLYSLGRLFQVPGVRARRVVTVGLGKAGELDMGKFLKVVGDTARSIRSGPGTRVASYLNEAQVPNRSAAFLSRQQAVAVLQANYRYEATVKRKPGGPGLSEWQMAGADSTDVAIGVALGQGQLRARELGNLPPNICTPAYLAKTAKELEQQFASLAVEVLDQDQMRALNMGALLGVGQGSANPPYLIIMRHQGGGDAKPFVLVGKGITFDTGGISIKPGAGMDEMKYDMCGAASVFGTMEAVARLNLPINVIGIVPAVENMPDGNSYRPGDVLTSMSGLTIEVLNTDAEGRLILCDALTYAKRFEPQALVDIATLTGACVVALGKHAHGLMGKHDDLVEELAAAGVQVHDRAWRLPLWDDYQPQLDSGFADMANIGGKNAGAITAGCFLARYTEGQRWAHLDIAGTAWDEGRKGSATGRPVPLLTEWLLRQAGQG
ncbi:MAG: leucyl aminopeptidase [Ahniella sp.]|nr:leucyl aminopeptidase [Ahniella sp.]